MSDSDVVESNEALSVGDWRAWLVCLSAGLFFFYEFFQLTLFDVINQPLRQSYQLSAAEVSWLSSTYLWANILFLLPAGMILDRFSTRKVILLTMSICVFATFGFGIINSFLWANFFHFLSGIGNAFCLLAGVVLVSRWFLPKQRALVVGVIVTMAFLGGMLAHTPFALLNEAYGWRFSLLIDALVGVILLGWIYLVVQDRPSSGEVAVTDQQVALFPGFFQALINRQNWLAGLYTTLLNLPIMILCALWGASYLQAVHHLSKFVAATLISLLFIGSMIGCPLMGWLSDRLGRRKLLMFIGAGATLVTVMPLCLNWHLSVLALSSLFFSLGFFTSAQIISYPLITESNDLKITGTATAIASVLIMGGGGLGQVLFGLLVQSSADFRLAMWLFPLAAAVALVLVGLIRETYCVNVRLESLCSRE